MSNTLLEFATRLEADLDENLYLCHPGRDKKRHFQLRYFKKKFRKKFTSAKAQRELSSVYLEDFIARNSIVRPPELPGEILAEARSFIEHALSNYLTKVDDSNIQETFDLDHFLSSWRFGPGASIATGSHTAVKMDQKFSVTPECSKILKYVTSTNPYLDAKIALDGGMRLVSGSKASTVPKNEDSVRVIATEPSGNMFLQLSAGRALEGVLSVLGFDIRSQEIRNRSLARQGSIDGSLATLDLSKASDSISLDLVRELVPSGLYRLLELIRSPRMTVLSQEISLKMISTMGNGFTFPLMTIIFLSLVYANRRVNHHGPRLYLNPKVTAVFGDDIVVPTCEVPGLINILELSGFTVNTAKTFAEGPFRESCGGDYFEGVMITPPYVTSISNNPDVYVALNQLLRYSGEHDIPLWRSIGFLYDLIDGKPFFVPEWEADYAGIKTSYVCHPRYQLYAVKQKSYTYKGDYDMMLACGGYLVPQGSRSVFVPRPTKTRYTVVKTRFPNGYLDGRSSVDYCDRVSSAILRDVLWLKTARG